MERKKASRRLRQKRGPKETDSAEEGTLFREGFTLLTRLASSTLETAPTCSPAWKRGLYVMLLNVPQVVFGRSVVVKLAPGFRALISRSTSHTCASMPCRARRRPKRVTA